MGVNLPGGGGRCWLGEHAVTGTQPRPMINIAYSCFLDETEGLVEGLQLPGPQAWILTIWSLQKKFAGFWPKVYEDSCPLSPLRSLHLAKHGTSHRTLASLVPLL